MSLFFLSFNSFFYAFNHLKHNFLVFNIFICHLKFLGKVCNPVDSPQTPGGLLSTHVLVILDCSSILNSFIYREDPV